jgi:general secretion pathway protein G
MRRRQNFTIIEILTVIVIISILTAIVLGVTHYATTKAHRTRTETRLTALELALEDCLQDRGYYPSTLSGATGRPDGPIQLGNYAPYSAVSSNEKLSEVNSGWVLNDGNFTNTQTGGLYLEGYKGGQYLDSWGRPFIYQCDGTQHNAQKFDIWSAGPDGESGTEDDITNWKVN